MSLGEPQRIQVQSQPWDGESLTPKGQLPHPRDGESLAQSGYPWAGGSCTPSRWEASTDAEHSPLPSALQLIEQSDNLPSTSAAQRVSQCYGSSQGVHLLHGNAQLFNTVHGLERHREWFHGDTLVFSSQLSSFRSEAWLQLDHCSQGRGVELIQGTENCAKTVHFISNWAHTHSDRQPDNKSSPWWNRCCKLVWEDNRQFLLSRHFIF